MGLIDEATAAQLRDAFAHLANPVRLVVFSPTLAEPDGEEVGQLVEELVALEPNKLSAEARSFVLEKERAAELGIERVPAIAVPPRRRGERSRRSSATSTSASSRRPLDPSAPGRSAWPAGSRSKASVSAWTRSK
jgi:hypothetical protein